MKLFLSSLLVFSLALLTSCEKGTAKAEPSEPKKLKALIVDGQNNHLVWPKSTIIMREYLEDTGLFEVDIARTKFISNWVREEAWLEYAEIGESEKLKRPQMDPDFHPDFSQYDVVISNFGNGAADWPAETQKSFEDYMKNGGGLVVVHAANNSWGQWTEFNKMIGVGGWGGRTEKVGPYVYCDSEGKVIRDNGPGRCGNHGPHHHFVITMQDKVHPITKGLPDFWMHGKDECYSALRGPAENMTILATANDSPKLRQTNRNEPMMMVIDYHQGRVFNTVLGHDVPAFECVGFKTTFLRGAEWVASGKVTQEIPADLPTVEEHLAEKFEYTHPE